MLCNHSVELLVSMRSLTHSLSKEGKEDVVCSYTATIQAISQQIQLQQQHNL